MRKDALRDKVAVVGVGCCRFGENWDQAPSDMIVDAAYEAYGDAGIEDPQKQIDAVFTGSIYSQKGPHECSDALKLFGKPVTMVSNYCATGTDAFRCGVMSIAAGVYDTVLVVGYDKPKDRGVSGPSVMMNAVRDLPQTPAGWFSLCAATYFEKYGASREDLGRIAIKNHHNGTLAPNSFLKREITMDEYLSGRLISWPFGLYDCAAQTDGAAAVVITRADLGRSFRKDPILVKGVTVIAGPNPQKDPGNDFLAWKPTGWAATDVYAQAGVTDPMKQIQVAQVHDCFSLTELLTYEDLGFVKKGEAKDAIRAGTFELGGALPVNTDGGLKSFGHPTGATGVRMIYENVLQLQGRAEKRQVPNAELALSHNIGGHPTACGIAILGEGVSYEAIRFEQADGVATITLNRPEKLNAYTVAMGEEAVDAFRRARADEAVRAVILTGAGRGFCAGVDLDALKAHQAGAAAGSGPKLGEEDFLTKLPLELLTFPKPVIAAINGAAIGVGVTMVLPCDVRLAAASAKLAVPFAKLGLLPGLGSTHLLPRLVGRAKAMELVLTAKTILAPEAAEIGLVNRVVADDQLLPEARAMAAQMAQCAPEVLAAAKAALLYGEDAAMADAMKNERERSAELRARKR